MPTPTLTQENLAEFSKNLPPGTTTTQIASLAATGATIGSVIPGIGTAVGAAVGTIMALAGVKIKGKTVTFSWNESNPVAMDLSTKLATDIKNRLSAAQWSQFSWNFPLFTAKVIENSGAWKQSERAKAATGIRVNHDRYFDPWHKVQGTLWEMFMWIMTQSPNDRQDWLEGYIDFYLDRTVGDFLKQIGVDVPSYYSEQTVPAPGASGPQAPTTQLQTVNKAAISPAVIFAGIAAAAIAFGVVKVK